MSDAPPEARRERRRGATWPWRGAAAAVASVASIALVAAGCGGRPPAAPVDRSSTGPATTRLDDRTSGATSPATATGAAIVAKPFVDPKSGARVSPPTGWASQPTKDYALVAAPPGVDPADSSVSLDVPDLPAHIPGWIPIGLVRDGYADDVRAAHPGATVEDVPPPAVAGGAKVRRTRAAWADARGPVEESALIVVRGDHVLILRGTAREPHAAAVREGFEAFARSLGWER